MLLRDLKTCFGVGIVLVLFALGLHAVYPCYNASADAGHDLLNVFAAALACTIPTFFIGALLFAHQFVRAEAKRNEQHRTLLLAELNEITEGPTSPARDRGTSPLWPRGEGDDYPPQPTVIEEAVKDGFFDRPRLGRPLLLAGRLLAYDSMVSYLLSLLFSGPARDPDREEIEETRRAVVAEAQMLAEPQRAALAFSVSRVLGSIRLLPRALLLPR